MTLLDLVAGFLAHFGGGRSGLALIAVDTPHGPCLLRFPDSPPTVTRKRAPFAGLEYTQGAVPVVKPQGTGETGSDRPAAPFQITMMESQT